ncbi:hypothetical protein C8Q78DRAFT_1058067 [Trametes maxima]|nr:hypothetical protein C8Q78DRAFT_1058067 [Trametes maxima]
MSSMDIEAERDYIFAPFDPAEIDRDNGDENWQPDEGDTNEKKRTPVKTSYVLAQPRASRGPGVHFCLRAGIHGQKDRGAFSIVVNGRYEDDKDYGKTIIYVGTGGHETPEDGGPQTSDQSFDHMMNKALLRSEHTRLPVRVVRGSELRSKYAPKKGFRYDGLYTVERAELKRGIRGFQICAFELRRLSGQNPIPRRNLSPAPARGDHSLESSQRPRDGHIPKRSRNIAGIGPVASGGARTPKALDKKASSLLVAHKGQSSHTSGPSRPDRPSASPGEIKIPMLRPPVSAGAAETPNPTRIRIIPRTRLHLQKRNHKKPPVGLSHPAVADMTVSSPNSRLNALNLEAATSSATVRALPSAPASALVLAAVPARTSVSVKEEDEMETTLSMIGTSGPQGSRDDPIVIDEEDSEIGTAVAKPSMGTPVATVQVASLLVSPRSTDSTRIPEETAVTEVDVGMAVSVQPDNCETMGEIPPVNDLMDVDVGN